MKLKYLIEYKTDQRIKKINKKTKAKCSTVRAIIEHHRETKLCQTTET